jgi:hypothetical protein
MSGAAQTSPPTQRASGRSAPRLAGTVVTALILAVGHTVTAYFTYLAYMANPAGSWDREAVSHSGFSSGITLALSVITALLTALFVKARWLRRWWYAIPVLLAVAALLRLTLLAPEL